MSKIKLLLLALVLMYSQSVSGEKLENDNNTIIKYNKNAPNPLIAKSKNETAWYHDIHVSPYIGAYVALQLHITKATNCTIVLSPVPANDKKIYTVDCRSLKVGHNDIILWSRFIRSKIVRVTVLGDASGLSLKIPFYAVPEVIDYTESIVGDTNDIIGINDLKAENLQQLKDSVALLHIFLKKGSYYCTGFLLEGGFLVTSYHCLGENVTGVNAHFKSEDKINNSIIVHYDPIPVTKNSLVLDYALLSPIIQNGVDNIKPLTLSDDKVNNGALLGMIHYPDGLIKKATVKNCNIESNKAHAFLLHTCDAYEGSSGAPMFDSNYKVIAIHKMGHENSNTDKRNKAVSAYLIAKHIKANKK